MGLFKLLGLFKKKYRPQKQFVSIAAGENQLPLIKAARQSGYNIISVDRNTQAPGFLLSDIRIQESIEDYDEIYKKLRELLLEGKINLVMSRSYGQATKTAALVCEKLKLPFIPSPSIDLINNKKDMKNIFSEHNIPTPSFIQYNPRRKRGYNYPLVIKPVEGHAKNGVKLLEGSEDLDRYLDANRELFKHFIMEEYIDGDEIIVFGLVHNRTFHLYEITDKITTPAPYFVDTMHISPSKYTERAAEISELGQKVVDAFSIERAPLVMEIKIKDDQLYVLEAVPEFGGEHIPEIIIPRSSGTNYFQSAINAMGNDQFSPYLFKKNRTPIVIKFISGKKGKLVSFQKPDTSISQIVDYKVFKAAGSTTSKPESNHDRIGFVAATDRTIEGAIEACDKAIESMKISYK